MIYSPTRADQRRARQILGNLREGESCSVIHRLAAGPLGRVVRFLAGCNVTFVFMARDEQHRVCSVGGPTADSVALLIRRVLDKRSSESSAGRVVDSVADQASDLSTLAAIRSPWIESGIDQLVDGLCLRDLSFVLGWSLPGENEGRLDCTSGAVSDKIDEWLHCFLTERLGVSACGESQHRSSEEVGARV